MILIMTMAIQLKIVCTWHYDQMDDEMIWVYSKVTLEGNFRDY